MCINFSDLVRMFDVSILKKNCSAMIIHIYICIYIHVYKYIYYTRMCIHICIYIYMYYNIYIYILYIYTYIYISTHPWAHVSTVRFPHRTLDPKAVLAALRRAARSSQSLESVVDLTNHSGWGPQDS